MLMTILWWRVVLKTTGSAFEGFFRDEFTTLGGQ